jgi:hypothetical protein
MLQRACILPVCLLAFITLLSAAPARADFFFSDDFNDGNDAGWTRYDVLAPFGAGGTYSFPSGGYRIQAPPSPNPALLGVGRAGALRSDFTLADFQVSVDLVDWNNSLDQALHVAARIGQAGLGTTDAYLLHYNTASNNLVLDRIDNEFPAPILASAPVTLDPSQDYRLVFTGIGSSLVGQVFSLSDLDTPLATVSATDATYSEGFVGVLGSGIINDLSTGATTNSPVDVTFDNFRAAAVPEPASLVLLGMGVAALFGYRWRHRATSCA